MTWRCEWKTSLSGGLTVGVEQVDPLAIETAGSECLSEHPGDAEHLGTQWLIHVLECGEVFAGHHQEVTRCDRVDVHERNHHRTTMDEAGLSPAGDDVAEGAGHYRPDSSSDQSSETWRGGSPTRSLNASSRSLTIRLAIASAARVIHIAVCDPAE